MFLYLTFEAQLVTHWQLHTYMVIMYFIRILWSKNIPVGFCFVCLHLTLTDVRSVLVTFLLAVLFTEWTTNYG